MRAIRAAVRISGVRTPVIRARLTHIVRRLWRAETRAHGCVRLLRPRQRLSVRLRGRAYGGTHEVEVRDAAVCVSRVELDLSWLEMTGDQG
jgi:hypothetical protein